METWDIGQPGLLRLPTGRLVRGRGLRNPAPAGPDPQFGLYLLAEPLPLMTWTSRWVRWRDWWLPADRDDARDAFRELWERAEVQRVEVACAGGLGRTGTALACVAVLDGVPAGDAVAYVRQHYNPQAVEAPWQRRYARHFRP